MTPDKKQKQFWNRHVKRNNNPRDPNASVLLGAFLSLHSGGQGDIQKELLELLFQISTNGQQLFILIVRTNFAEIIRLKENRKKVFKMLYLCNILPEDQASKSVTPK